MQCFTKLFVLTSLDRIQKSTIKQGLKKYFLKRYLEENYQKLDFSANLLDDTANFAHEWIHDCIEKGTLEQNIRDILTKLENSKLDVNRNPSYIKFLYTQLTNGYMFMEYYPFQFDMTFEEKENVIRFIKDTLINLHKNNFVIFDNISQDELMDALADIALNKQMFNNFNDLGGFILADEFHTAADERVVDSNNTSLLVKGRFDINAEYGNELYQNIAVASLVDLISPLGKARNVLTTDFNNILQAVDITITPDLQQIFYNHISNRLLFMNLIESDTKYALQSDISKDLFKYISDVMIREAMEFSGDYYNKIDKTQTKYFRKLVDMFRSDYLPLAFFNEVANEDPSSTNLSPKFNRAQIDNIYRRYNKTFDAEPQHFNQTIYRMKEVLCNEDRIPVSKYNNQFTPIKMNQFFDDYIKFKIYSTWLNDTGSPRSSLDMDKYHLIPEEYSSIESVKSLLNNILLDDFTSHEKTEADKDIKKAYNLKSGSLNGMLQTRVVMTLKDALIKRLDGYYWYNFHLNKFKDKRKINNEFYRYLNRYINEFDESSLNNIIESLNSEYDHLTIS